MTRELNILTVLAALTLLLFSGWLFLVGNSTIKNGQFSNRQTQKVSPVINIDLLTK